MFSESFVQTLSEIVVPVAVGRHGGEYAVSVRIGRMGVVVDLIVLERGKSSSESCEDGVTGTDIPLMNICYMRIHRSITTDQLQNLVTYKYNIL